MSPCMHVERPFHVIVKHMMATETSGDYQPGNKGLLCGLSTHRTEIFYSNLLFIFFNSHVKKTDPKTLYRTYW